MYAAASSKHRIFLLEGGSMHRRISCTFHLRKSISTTMVAIKVVTRDINKRY